ncbi:MAG: hypothetical protein IT291_00930, partial [Deltaproteobacteria bacterium]|nr:hypothetical protein [Deltaproteobacteria bacterium]
MKCALQKPHFVTRFRAKPGIRRIADMLFAASMFVIGFFVLGLGLGSISPAMAEKVDTSSIKCMVAMLFYLTEGDFGALIMVVAGISMLVSAALGNYKAATSLLVVAIG